MTEQLMKKITELVEEISTTDDPAETMLDVFVEMMGEVGVTPNYIGDSEGNVVGVYLTLTCRGKERKSAPLPTSIPLRTA